MKKRKRFIILSLILLCSMGSLLGVYYLLKPAVTTVSYAEFYQTLKDDRIKILYLSSNTFQYMLREDIPEEADLSGMDVLEAVDTLKGLDTPIYSVTNIPVDNTSLFQLLEQNNVQYYSDEPTNLDFIFSLILTIACVAMAIGTLLMILRSLKGFVSPTATVSTSKNSNVTFEDVAGQEEAKASLQEMVHILRNPEKYQESGAVLPKGALLVGPPGTGKTLLAKAVAGEAGVPFIYASGSSFVEMFVGVGASRVRKLFETAASNAPCILFLDEIDAVGATRGNRSGHNEEQGQTLNQLLAEMDGFDPCLGVIVLAATNRPEILDAALLRPGRFDRQIHMEEPNLAGRLETLKVHTRNKKLAEDVDLNQFAIITTGCVGADLASFINEAALRAVRQERQAITQEDLLAAFELVIAGPEKHGSALTESEKRLVAYHEVGHAVVAHKTGNTEPVQKITIVPHTKGSLGYTLLTPEEEKTDLRTKEELLAKIKTCMGGRAAEEVMLNTCTTGAAQDIQEATAIARNMVTMFGMCDAFGMMALASNRSKYLHEGIGLDCSPGTAERMEEEVRTLLAACYVDAVRIIQDNHDAVESITSYLLEKETISGKEMLEYL